VKKEIEAESLWKKAHMEIPCSKMDQMTENV
jgi:hypothetical protein